MNRKISGAISVLLVVALMLPAFSGMASAIADELSGTYATGSAGTKELRTIDPSSEWRYIDDNSDPFETTPLYILGQTSGHVSEVNEYRHAWSLPNTYTDQELNAVLGYTVDIGVDDSAWNIGAGPFGYKNGTAPDVWGTLGTILNGNIAGTSDRIETYFFRYNFALAAEDIPRILSVSYEIFFDDAVIIYLNGTEIGRHNTPAGGYTQNVQYGAASTVGDMERGSGTLAIPAGLLQEYNTIAVELHQDRAASSDIYMNFTDLTFSAEAAETGGNGEIGTNEISVGAPNAAVFTITNTGDQPTGPLTVSLTGQDASVMILSTELINNIDAGGMAIVAVIVKNGLHAGTYTASAVISGDNISKTVDIIIIVEAIYGISLSETGTYVFRSEAEGYASAEQVLVNVENKGNTGTGTLTVKITGDGAEAFEAIPATIGDIPMGGSATFAVVPTAGLAAGTYTATVTVTDESGRSESFNISFTVEAAVFDISLGGQNSVVITITNKGNQPTDTLTATLSGPNASDMILSASVIDSIAVGGKEKMIVMLRPDLSAGTYVAILTVEGDNGIFETFYICFTSADPIYDISMDRIGTQEFPDAYVGYSDVGPMTVNVENTGTASTGPLTVTLGGPNASAFELSGMSFALQIGAETSFTVAPKNSLAPGTYTATVTVTGENGISGYFGVSFRVIGSEPAYNMNSLTMQPGSDETQRNFTWYSDSPVATTLTVWASGDEANATAYTSATSSTAVSGYLSNKVTVTDLEAGTYFYQIRTGSALSDVYTFKVQPSDVFSFVLVGDVQIGSSGNVARDTQGWQTTMTNILTEFPELAFIVSGGDQVETAGTEPQYSGFLTPEELKSLAMAPTLGNHDNGDNYGQHFNMPNYVGSNAYNGDYWYSYGSVMFMHLNSNDTNIANHRTFMVNAIAQFEEIFGEAPEWKIVVFHHGLYSNASHTADSDIYSRRASWSPVLAELDIDAVLNGHDHVYTRSFVMSDVLMGSGTGRGMVPITEGYIAVGDNLYAEYAKLPGQVVYIEANSASGSKYYAVQNTAYDFVAAYDQTNTPTVTKVDVVDGALVFTTYYSTEAGIDLENPIDTFTLRHAQPVPPEPADEPAKLLIASIYAGNINEKGALATGVPVSHSFIEIYNPNDFDVCLDGYYVFYQGYCTQYAENRDGWAGLALDPIVLQAKTSYLINCGETADGTTLVLTTFDQTWENAPGFVTKGSKYVITYGIDSIDASIVDPFDIDGNGTKMVGYVDMFGCAGNDAGTTDLIDGYAGDYYSEQSKQKGFERIDRNVDTENNKDDFRLVDYRDPQPAPRSMIDGPLGGGTDETDPTEPGDDTDVTVPPRCSGNDDDQGEDNGRAIKFDIKVFAGAIGAVMASFAGVSALFRKP
ncbi:MAG: metallophosphoesterase [Methanomassiliicoccaceae archaeon]|nr:metallophosphoesterase [Methanomassiliicoccaceae archaeon]